VQICQIPNFVIVLNNGMIDENNTCSSEVEEIKDMENWPITGSQATLTINSFIIALCISISLKSTRFLRNFWSLCVLVNAECFNRDPDLGSFGYWQNIGVTLGILRQNHHLQRHIGLANQDAQNIPDFIATYPVPIIHKRQLTRSMHDTTLSDHVLTLKPSSSRSECPSSQ
jgi:hypothetical protein